MTHNILNVEYPEVVINHLVDPPWVSLQNYEGAEVVVNGSGTGEMRRATKSRKLLGSPELIRFY